MPIRTNDDLVAEIIEGIPAGTDFAPFIAVANQLVDEVCLGSDYSDERLTLIETWLSAHFYSVMVPQTTQERAGIISETKDIQTALHLSSSRWGQTALILDTEGNLAALSRDMEMGRRTFVCSMTSLAVNPNTSTRDALLDE